MNTLDKSSDVLPPLSRNLLESSLMNVRTMDRSIESQATSDGTGVKRRRSFGGSPLRRHDPFLAREVGPRTVFLDLAARLDVTVRRCEDLAEVPGA